MLRTSRKRQNRTGGRIITGDAATDSLLWRLSLVLKEIAESRSGYERLDNGSLILPLGRAEKKGMGIYLEGGDRGAKSKEATC
jgi:hypothetical protein